MTAIVGNSLFTGADRTHVYVIVLKLTCFVISLSVDEILMVMSIYIALYCIMFDTKHL